LRLPVQGVGEPVVWYDGCSNGHGLSYKEVAVIVSLL
jgi:hypothetical protein